MVRKPLRCAWITLFLFCTLILMLASDAWAASKYKVLYSFQGGSDGASPYGGLTLDAAGNLYGTTYFGGVDNQQCYSVEGTGCGTVFKLTPGSGAWTESLLYNFCSQTGCADGATPIGSMSLDSGGTLYGTTGYGGSCRSFLGCGVAFNLAPDSQGTWQYTVLYDFPGGDNAGNPDGDLIFERRGNLYGTGGVVFALIRRSGNWSEKIVYSFCSLHDCRDGFGPAAGLVWRGGDLYGATYYGGWKSYACDAGCGVLFKLTPGPKGRWKETVLHTLVGADGTNPLSGPIFDGHGNLYGTTTSDGAFGGGTMFKLSPTSRGRWKYGVLHDFRLGELFGSGFTSSLVFDKAGNLYGTAWTGGSGNCNGGGCGLVYKLAPGAHGRWKYTELYTFTGSQDGGVPVGNLAIDQNGNLYGAAELGGATGNGVVFEVTP